MVSADSRYALACCAKGHRFTFSDSSDDIGGLDAPTVAFGMLQRALHLFTQTFCEHRGRHVSPAWPEKIGGSIAAAKHAKDGLLYPVCFQRQAKSIAQHHRRAQNCPDWIRRVRSGKRRRRAMNGLEERRS